MKLESLGKNIAKYCFYIFIVVYAVANIFFTVRQYNVGSNEAHYLFGITIEHIIIVGILLLILFLYLHKANFKINNKIFLIIFLIACVVLGLYWIFSNHPVLIEIDDAYNCYRAANLVGQGDYGPLGYKSYINTYPHNLSLVSYFMIFTRLFGDNATTAIRLVNLVFVLIGYYSLYKIGYELFNNEDINTITIFLMFLSMQFVFYAFFVYGNVVSYASALFSVYFFIKYFKENKLSYLIISGISIIISVAIKNNSMIVLVAEIIYIIIHIIDKKKWKLSILVILVIIGQFICTTGVTKFWELRSGNDYSNKLPRLCWIAYGINYDPRHPGGYMNEFEVYHHENGFVAEYTEQRAKEFIDGVLKNFKEKPYLIPRFYAQKFLVSFANPGYETFAQYRELPQTEFNESVISGDINDVLNEIWDATSTIVSIGLLVYMIKHFKKITLLELIGGVIVFGGFLFHLFWETKAIYLYQYYMYLLPYAACGLYLLMKKNSEVD